MLSAMRPARGKVAWIFLPRILDRVVADGGGIDWLHFLRWVSDGEPDALKNVGRGCGLFQLPKSRRGLRCHRVRRRLLQAVNLHEQPPRRTSHSRRAWMVWEMPVGLTNK
jgi:hypothetical protein